MSKTVVIHQPDFLPYLGFFHRFLHADMYIALDNVQFCSSSRSWTNRDKIKTPNGEKWLSISVNKAPRDTNINDICINYAVDWQTQNLNLLRQNYSKAEYFNEVFPYIEGLYDKKYEKLSNLTLESIRLLNELFDIRIEIILSSTLRASKAKSERLVELLQQVGATHYLSGVGARDYHDDEPFKMAGIEVIWQDFTPPVYPQLHGDFIPYLSSIDLLFNCGIRRSREILRSI